MAEEQTSLLMLRTGDLIVKKSEFDGWGEHKKNIALVSYGTNLKVLEDNDYVESFWKNKPQKQTFTLPVDKVTWYLYFNF